MFLEVHTPLTEKRHTRIHSAAMRKDSGSRSSISGTMTAYLDGFLSHIQVALLKGREENIITKNLQRVAGEIRCLIHVLKQPSRSTNHNVCFSNPLLLMFQILYKDKPVS